MWWPIYGGTADTAKVVSKFALRIRLGIIVGAILFVTSGLAEAVRAASQVIDPTVFEELWLFLTVSRYGQMSLLKACITPIFVCGFLFTYRRKAKVAATFTGIIGFVLLCSISLTSHAAARPDFFPFLSDLVHMLAVVIWGGGLLCFAALPWRDIRADLPGHTRLIGRLVERFSTLAIMAVLAIATTGAIASFLHVYGWLTDKSQPHYFSSRFLVLKAETGLATHGILLFRCHRGFGVRFTA